MSYYTIQHDVSEDSPLLGFKDGGLKVAILQGMNVTNGEAIDLIDLKEKKGTRVLGDYQICAMPVVSSELFSVLEPLLPDNVSHAPVAFDFSTKGKSEGYRFLSIEARHKCVNIDESVFEGTKRMIHSFDKLVLDESVLEGIPLEERLVFRLKEKPSLILWHDSLAKKTQAAIKAIDGVALVPIEEGV